MGSKLIYLIDPQVSSDRAPRLDDERTADGRRDVRWQKSPEPSRRGSLGEKQPEASFLKERLRLRGKLAPTQWWHSAQLVPMRELAPAQKLAPALFKKNWPLDPILRLLNLQLQRQRF
jgi:hypothetical protein